MTGYWSPCLLFRLSLWFPPCVCYNKQASENWKSPGLKAKNSGHTEQFHVAAAFLPLDGVNRMLFCLTLWRTRFRRSFLFFLKSTDGMDAGTHNKVGGLLRGPGQRRDRGVHAYQVLAHILICREYFFGILNKKFPNNKTGHLLWIADAHRVSKKSS